MLDQYPAIKGNIHIKKCGFKTVEISGIEVVQGKTTYQEVSLIPIVERKRDENTFVYLILLNS